MTNNFDANSWEFTQRIIRIGHNRRVKKYFRDIDSDTSTNTGRAAIKTALLIRDNDSAIESLNKQIYFQNNLDNANLQPIVAYPEDYQLRVENKRPQLAIIFKPTKKGLTDKQYLSHLPHYKGDKKPSIKSYYKGNYWARLVLKDNSHIRINGRTETEATNMIKLYLRYVDIKYRVPSNQITTGRYHDNPFKELKLVPYRADFYPEGKKDAYPKWQHYFKEGK